MDESKLFIGQVISSNPGSFALHIVRESAGISQGDAASAMQGLYLSSTLATFLGFKEAVLPQPGSRVLCLMDSSTQCYVLGTIPQADTANSCFPSRMSLKQGDPGAEKAFSAGHVDKITALLPHRRPTDAMPGDYSVVNEFGVLLWMSQLFSTLKASELAQVQCFLMDDLVRIVSHNFQHYTALGEYNVYHDGNALMAEFSGTSIPAEMYGVPCPVSSEGPPTFKVEDDPQHTIDDKKDFYKFSDHAEERIRAIERFKFFLGRLGDVVRFMVVRPREDAYRILGKPSEQPDTGMMDMHVSPDGGVYVRSLKEIFLEKSAWIRVPHRDRAPDDPEGDKDVQYETKKIFAFKKDYKYKENPFVYSLQIRDYLAYVDEDAGYKNFKKHKKDFFINDAVSKEKKISEISQVDENTQTSFSDYELRTAGIYMMPNGGIMIKDAWNSAIVLEGGNISLQPAKDLFIEPLRNLVAKVGGFTSIATKQDVDISSTNQGFRLKTKKSQYFYSDKSGIVLECRPEKDTAGTPDPEEDAIKDVGGIVFKSTKGIFSYADKLILNYSKEKMLFQAKTNCDFVVDRRLTLFGKEQLLGLSDKSIAVVSSEDVQISAQSNVYLSGKKGTILGEKDERFGITADKLNALAQAAAGGLHGVLDTEKLVKAYDVYKKNLDNVLEQTVFEKEETFDKLKFKFLKSSRYGQLTNNEDSVPGTVPQQEDKLSNLYKLEEWKETEVNQSLPYPGKEKFEEFFFDAEKPKNLQKQPGGKDYVHKADPAASPATIKIASLQKFKVQKTIEED